MPNITKTYFLIPSCHMSFTALCDNSEWGPALLWAPSTCSLNTGDWGGHPLSLDSGSHSSVEMRRCIFRPRDYSGFPVFMSCRSHHKDLCIPTAKQNYPGSLVFEQKPLFSPTPNSWFSSGHVCSQSVQDCWHELPEYNLEFLPCCWSVSYIIYHHDSEFRF